MPDTAPAPLPDATTAQRRVLLVAILASFVSFLDGSVVNVALPAIAGDLVDGPLVGLSLQQWVVDAYLLTLGALILLAGSLSDVLGRRRVLVAGLVGFAVASVLCAIAPTGLLLVLARALQGVAGALLVPSSLAMIIAAYSGAAQARAIGVWTAWTGTASIAGPLLGGLLVDHASWRWVFWINVPVLAVTLLLARRVAPDAPPSRSRRIDVVGAVLAVVGLAGAVLALIEQGRLGWTHPVVLGGLAIGVVGLAAFVAWERRTPDPMLPLRLFRSRTFAWGNLATAAVYAALYVGGLLVTLFLQEVAGWSATAAGLSQLPITVIMLVLSARFGALAGRFGPRLFMTAGPIVGAVGYLLMLGAGEDVRYATQLLPGLLVFGLGLAITVAPLTAAILGAVGASDAGIGSAVNNAVSRVAGLVAVALLGTVVGGALTVSGFQRGLVVVAALLAVGGAISWVGIRNPRADV